MKVFQHELFGSLRIISHNGAIWMIGKDVANILGYNRGRDAIAKYVDPVDREYMQINTGSGGRRKMIIINESGMEKLVKTKMPKAKEAKLWMENTIQNEKQSLYSSVSVCKEDKTDITKDKNNENLPICISDFLQETHKNSMSSVSDFLAGFSSSTKDVLLAEMIQILYRQNTELINLKMYNDKLSNTVLELKTQCDKQKSDTETVSKQISGIKAVISFWGIDAALLENDNPRKLINALVSRYAVRVKNRQWNLAWDDFKKTLKSGKNGLDIDVDARIRSAYINGEKKPTAISVLKASEMQTVVLAAAKMCREHNIYIKDLYVT